jgi:hypothetical protein
MNLDGNDVTSYKELLEEKQKLQVLIQNQKNIIRHDLQELKTQFKKEIKPAIDAGKFVKKITAAEARNKTVLTIGARLAIDLLARTMLRNSNIFVRTFLPVIAKNISHRIFSKKTGGPSPNLRTLPE